VLTYITVNIVVCVRETEPGL